MSSSQLGEQLKQLVPAGGLTVMDLEAEGTCLRFSPLMTAAGNQAWWTSLAFVLGLLGRLACPYDTPFS